MCKRDVGAVAGEEAWPVVWRTVTLAPGTMKGLEARGDVDVLLQCDKWVKEGTMAAETRMEASQVDGQGQQEVKPEGCLNGEGEGQGGVRRIFDFWLVDGGTVC